MRTACALILVVVAATLAGCGGSSNGSVSRAPIATEPLRILPPEVTFTYDGVASVGENGLTRTVPASSVVTIGPPGFTDPRTNTPVLLYTQTLTVGTVETLLYRDFFFSQPTGAFVAHGSEVFGVATFDFGPALLLPAQLAVGQMFGQQTEPYQTLTVRLRGGNVIRIDRITVAGAIVDAFEIAREREIPMSRVITRQFDERFWIAPGIAGPVPVKQRIRYSHNGVSVNVELEMTGIPALP